METNYSDLFVSSYVLPAKVMQVLRLVDRIEKARYQYEDVEDGTGIPWWCVAAIHNLESSLNFSCHLHNGDPLTARTTHVPAGRPVAGTPPFEWSVSASDALSSTWRPTSWNLDGCLEFMERYNGLGYRKYGIYSPYLWSFTNLYVSGLFVADGKFDPFSVSGEVGAAALLKSMEEQGLVQFNKP